MIRARSVVLLALVACEARKPDLSRDELLDPVACKECHPRHYEEWAGSLHAYSSDDPYFRALNALGQDATDGALGGLCVGCHAPTAVREGATVDGLNLDEVPQHLKGITCHYCHTVDSVENLHNNGLVLAGDGVMLGGIGDPVDTPAHLSDYSQLLDGRSNESSELCGGCHDVVLPNGVHLERTYLEWDESFYADVDQATGWPAQWGQRCNSCHLPGEDGPIADADDARADRRHHDHRMPGPGVVIDDFPDPVSAPDLKEANLEAMHELRRTALCASLCVEEVAADQIEITVWLHNETAGHGWPSGAAQDRRAWVEVQAQAGGNVTFASGVVAAEESVDAHAKTDDADFWWFGDRIFDADGNETHHAWEVASYESQALPVAQTLGGDPDTWVSRTYQAPGPMPESVSLRVSIRPMPLELLEEMVQKGFLAAEHRDALPSFDVEGAHLDWTPEVAEPSDAGGTCISSSASCGSPFI